MNLKSILNFLAPLLITYLKTEGKPKAIEFLQKQHDKHLVFYEYGIVVLYTLFTRDLQNLVANTDTTIVDQTLTELVALLQESAAANGITLPAFPPRPAAELAAPAE